MRVRELPTAVVVAVACVFAVHSCAAHDVANDAVQGDTLPHSDNSLDTSTGYAPETRDPGSNTDTSHTIVTKTSTATLTVVESVIHTVNEDGNTLAASTTITTTSQSTGGPQAKKSGPSTASNVPQQLADDYLDSVFHQHLPAHIRLVLLYCRHTLMVNSPEPASESYSATRRAARDKKAADSEERAEKDNYDDDDQVEEHVDKPLKHVEELHKVVRHLRRHPHAESLLEGNLDPNAHTAHLPVEDESYSMLDFLNTFANNLLSLFYFALDTAYSLMFSFEDGTNSRSADLAEIMVLNSSYYVVPSGSSTLNETATEQLLKRAQSYFDSVVALDTRPRPESVPEYVDYYGEIEYNLSKDDPKFVLDPFSVFPNFNTVEDDTLIKTKALRILRFLALEYDIEEALELLGDVFLYGLYYQKRDFRKSFRFYNKLSELGSPIGHRKVGLMYAIGLGTKRDYAKAVLYFGFAAGSAHNSDLAALQILGYYHNFGIATERSCIDASYFYKRAAGIVKKDFESGPPLGKVLPPSHSNIYDVNGGLYGSVSSGVGDPLLDGNDVASRPKNSNDGFTEDIIALYHVLADAGEVVPMAVLGQLYYSGNSLVKRDYVRSMEYWKRALKAVDVDRYAAGGEIDIESAGFDAGQEIIVASQAAGYIGLMHLRGEGVPQDNSTARQYFELGVSLKNGMSFLGLGVMLLDGSGGLQADVAKGTMFIRLAAENGNSDAQYIIAKYYLERGMDQLAVKFLTLASTRFNIGAYYTLADVLLTANETMRKACDKAVLNFKMITEKADWHDSNMRDGLRFYKHGDYERAFVHFLISSELGYDDAQSSAAYLVDSGLLSTAWSEEQRSNLSGKDSCAGKKTCKKPHRVGDTEIAHDVNELPLWDYALSLWHRAWAQGNVDAGNKIGDYYFYGIGNRRLRFFNEEEVEKQKESQVQEGDKGTNKATDGTVPTPDKTVVHRMPVGVKGESEYEVDFDRAAMFYLLTRNENSALGMWNLAFMYEHGLGVGCDLTMAETLYKESMRINPHAYVAGTLSVALVQMKRALGTLSSFRPSMGATYIAHAACSAATATLAAVKSVGEGAMLLVGQVPWELRTAAVLAIVVVWAALRLGAVRQRAARLRQLIDRELQLTAAALR